MNERRNVRRRHDLAVTVLADPALAAPEELVDLSRKGIVATLRDPEPDHVVCTRGHRDRGAAG